MPRKMLRPPIKLRKLFAPLIELCRNKVLTAVPQTSGAPGCDLPITIVLKFAVENNRIVYPAEGFPTGQTTEKGDGWVAVKFDVKRLLSFFKANHYTTYDAGDLFQMRLPVMMRIAKMELGLDRMLDSVESSLDADLQQVDTED